MKVKNNRRKKKTVAPAMETNSTQDDLDFLKSVVVEPQNIDAIAEKLKLTADYRKQMARDLNVDLYENFPFFSPCPKR